MRTLYENVREIDLNAEINLESTDVLVMVSETERVAVSNLEITSLTDRVKAKDLKEERVLEKTDETGSVSEIGLVTSFTKEGTYERVRDSIL